MQALLAAIVAGVFGYVFVTASFIVAAVRLAAGFWPRFSRALLCSTVLFVLTLIVLTALQPIVGNVNGAAPTSAVMLVLNTVVVNGLIRRPDGSSIGWIAAGAASLIQTAFEIAMLVLFTIALAISLVEAFLRAV